MTELYKTQLLKKGFELQDKIGSGLSGSTMKGLQSSLNRPVAIKFFDSILNLNNDSLRKKFLRESLLLAEAQHPSIPYVITTGRIRGGHTEIPYIIMQYISGLTLEQYIKRSKAVSVETAIGFSAQILDALNFVHEKKIVHRDIKPSNIMVLPSGHCYLIDFSIGFKETSEEGMTRATRTGDHLGSVKYMSPEQKEDMKGVDSRTDTYSYALVLCELLVGKPDLLELDSLKHKFSPGLIKVLKKAASYRAEDRYKTASDFLRELKQMSATEASFLDTPKRAICSNTKCPDANWSDNGYYRGPNFITESSTLHCTSCGERLVYQCANCNAPIDNTRFCGGCGTEQFTVPECVMCGSFLKKIDMGKDTDIDGCDKCKSERLQASTVASVPTYQPKKPTNNFDDFDDDIPF